VNPGNYKDWERFIDEDPDGAAKQAAKTLDEDPENALALFVVATVYQRAERFGIAANIYQRITQVKADRAEPWNNLGMCWAGLGLNIKARHAFHEAWKREKSGMFAANIGMTHFADRDFKKAIEWCEKALSMGESKSANTTLGMTYLSLGDWEKAWPLYDSSVGGKFRKDVQFQDEPRWNGEKGKSVVFYGEQGLGDEIMYASCIAEAQKDCREVILECDERLEGLFARSFPGVAVYGTRRQEGVTWPTRHKIEARCPVGQIAQFYRPSPKSCPGTPYLKADPERRIQWNALLASFGSRPKVGLCWSGGSKYNKPKDRTIGLERLRPLIKSIDATWVSLQYKDPTEEIAKSGLPVHHWKRACETNDYDDTAALVAELDMVIGVHTSAHHLAGALGVPGIVLVPFKTIWVYSLPDGSMPWYKSARLFKQREDETWDGTIRRLLDGESLRWLRPEGDGGVPRLLPVSDKAFKPTGHIHTFGAAVAEGV
jgi:tetratricopeptide (TPR) repeat protein